MKTTLPLQAKLWLIRHRKTLKRALLLVGVALLVGDFVAAMGVVLALEPWAHPMGATGAITTAVADALEA